MPFILRYPLVARPVSELNYAILNGLYGWIECA